MSRLANMEKTKTGIVIGRAYIPPPSRELGSEAERIQKALLAKPTSFHWRVLLMRFRTWKACLGKPPF